MDRSIFVGIRVTPEQQCHLNELSMVAGDPGNYGAGLQWLLEQSCAVTKGLVRQKGAQIITQGLQACRPPERAILLAIAKLETPTLRDISEAVCRDRANCFRRIKRLVSLRLIREIEGYPTRYELMETEAAGNE